jgi:hypothetical protein
LRFQQLFVLITLTSFPLWYNLSWGQVGVITTVAILGMLAMLERGRRLSAAALVGFSASFKFFPLPSSRLLPSVVISASCSWPSSSVLRSSSLFLAF